MPRDRSAQAAQLARIIEHEGELLVFGDITFSATLEPYLPPTTDTDRNTGDDTSLLIKASRAIFGTTLPRQGSTFTDAADRLYRVQSVPSIPPQSPLIHFVCAVVPTL